MSGEELHAKNVLETSQQREVLARELRAFVKDHGISTTSELLEVLAGAGLMVARSSIARWMTGRATPTWEMLSNILVAVNAGGTTFDKSMPLDLNRWRDIHQAASNRVQSNIFQVGRDYAYISNGHVAIGADNHTAVRIDTTAAGSDEAGDAGNHVAEYLEELEQEITLVAKAARRRLLIYRTLRFAALTASAVTPAVALLNAAPWVTASVGTVAFLAEGTIQLTRLNERAVLDTRRTSNLSREFRMYRTQVGDYTSTESFTLLVQRVEEIRQQNDSERLDVVQQSFGAHVPSNDQPQALPK